MTVRQRHMCSLVAVSMVDIIHLPLALLVPFGSKAKLDILIQLNRLAKRLLSTDALNTELRQGAQWRATQRQIVGQQEQVRYW
jgi:hypothetical protein